MAQAKNREQYESWVDAWSADLYRFAYRLCGQGDLAEDLVQETFFHAWRSMHSLRDPGRARAWLYQILRHRYAHWVRADARRPAQQTPPESFDRLVGNGQEQPLARMVRDEQLQLALDALEERYRQPLLLVFLEGLTCRQAAEQLKVPLGTVLSRIHRARRFLRERMPKAEPGPPTVRTFDAPAARLRFRGGA